MTSVRTIGTKSNLSDARELQSDAEFLFAIDENSEVALRERVLGATVHDINAMLPRKEKVMTESVDLRTHPLVVQDRVIRNLDGMIFLLHHDGHREHRIACEERLEATTGRRLNAEENTLDAAH